ncbi:MAG: sulfatase [Planctomycetaceae bacterium]|nr:sulfatase [Planctomycetaceae bacterium]
MAAPLPPHRFRPLRANRQLLPLLAAGLAMCLLEFCLPDSCRAADSTRPNIVLIFADDLGWRDTGFSGSTYCRTPHLDQLAKQGMVFRHAYAAAGNCAPSRACLISGQYTPRHHVYAVGSTNRGQPELMRMIPVPNTNSLPGTATTLGETLQAAGYATGYFGKTHLVDKGKGKSERRGFDVVKVSQHGLNSDDPQDPKGIFSITEAACGFIEANRKQPFFAYIPHYAVHTRIEARVETLKKFQQQEPGTHHDDPLFAACIADLDTGIGRVLETLDRLKLTDNTLVVFTSDNGGTNWSQEPLRGKKGSYDEGGIRVPMAVRWPGIVPAGTTCDVPVISIDLYPTFLAVAGIEPPPNHTLDGTSLVPLFAGKPRLERPGIFWHFPGYLNGPVPRGRDPVFRTRPVSVIRDGDWKLLLYHEEWQLDGGRAQLDTNNAVELYNLAADPGEHHNLASRNPQQRDKLLQTLLDWFESTDALLPTKPNPQYDAAARKAAEQKAAEKKARRKRG